MDWVDRILDKAIMVAVGIVYATSYLEHPVVAFVVGIGIGAVIILVWTW